MWERKEREERGKERYAYGVVRAERERVIAVLSVKDYREAARL